MLTIDHILNFVLTEQEVKNCIQKAKNNFKIAQLDNLRSRHPNIQFDCMLRGYVGEYALSKWVQSHGIELETTNLLMEGDNMDIDFLYKEKNIELKTSLIPDVDATMEKSIQIRDIKLIRRVPKIEDLKGDIHLQIYYRQRRQAKDTWLIRQNINLQNNDIDYLYKELLGKAYLDSTFFVAWIDKPTLIQRIYALPENKRVWSYAKREFWVCPIRESKHPAELIAYLKTL